MGENSKTQISAEHCRTSSSCPDMGSAGPGQYPRDIEHAVIKTDPTPGIDVQALAGVREPGTELVEDAAHLPGGPGVLLVRVRGDQDGVHAGDQPSRQAFPAAPS